MTPHAAYRPSTRPPVGAEPLALSRAWVILPTRLTAHVREPPDGMGTSADARAVAAPHTSPGPVGLSSAADSLPHADPRAHLSRRAAMDRSLTTPGTVEAAFNAERPPAGWDVRATRRLLRQGLLPATLACQLAGVPTTVTTKLRRYAGAARHGLPRHRDPRRCGVRVLHGQGAHI